MTNQHCFAPDDFADGEVYQPLCPLKLSVKKTFIKTHMP